MEPDPPLYFSGLDLGCLSDYSALVVVERNTIPNPDKPGGTLYTFDVRHIHRWQLRTPYPTIVEEVKEMYAKPPLAKSVLVVDQTGVGKPVVDMFRAAKIGASLRPYNITHGSGVTGQTVAKKHLVGAVQAPLCSGRLRFAKGLALTAALTKELENFRVNVTESRNEQYSAWRESDHDDIVLALSLALFVADRPQGWAAFVG